MRKSDCTSKIANLEHLYDLENPLVQSDTSHGEPSSLEDIKESVLQDITVYLYYLRAAGHSNMLVFVTLCSLSVLGLLYPRKSLSNPITYSLIAIVLLRDLVEYRDLAEIMDRARSPIADPNGQRRSQDLFQHGRSFAVIVCTGLYMVDASGWSTISAVFPPTLA